LDSKLAELFALADIDDITDEDEGITLVFTQRSVQSDVPVQQVVGESLEDALDQALALARREDALNRIRSEGLTERDLDRLVGSDDDERVIVREENAWRRGYDAGRAVVSQPAAAAAGEPFTGDGALLALLFPVRVTEV
jgi:hypothetical protein